MPEKDGREEGLLFAVMNLARCERFDEVLGKRGIPVEIKARAQKILKDKLDKNKERYGSYGLR